MFFQRLSARLSRILVLTALAFAPPVSSRAGDVYVTGGPMMTSSVGDYFDFMGGRNYIYTNSMASGPGLPANSLVDGNNFTGIPPYPPGYPVPAPTNIDASVAGNALVSGSLSSVTRIDFALSTSGSMTTTVGGYGNIDYAFGGQMDYYLFLRITTLTVYSLNISANYDGQGHHTVYAGNDIRITDIVNIQYGAFYKGFDEENISALGAGSSQSVTSSGTLQPANYFIQGFVSIAASTQAVTTDSASASVSFDLGLGNGAVPEPSSVWLLAAGVVGFSVLLRKKQSHPDMDG